MKVIKLFGPFWKLSGVANVLLINIKSKCSIYNIWYFIEYSDLVYIEPWIWLEPALAILSSTWQNKHPRLCLNFVRGCGRDKSTIVHNSLKPRICIILELEFSILNQFNNLVGLVMIMSKQRELKQILIYFHIICNPGVDT